MSRVSHLTSALLLTVVAGGLTPAAFAASESVLYGFQKSQGQGFTPLSHPILYQDDVIYGTTEKGGAYKYGTVFQMTKDQFGNWNESILYNFEGRNFGAYPKAGVARNSTTGNLYATTEVGGTNNDGAVFELKYQGGVWHARDIYNFKGGNADGSHPYADISVDQTTGTLYGTTYNGSAGNCGVVYALIPSGNTWAEQVISTLEGAGGCNSQSALREDTFGNLYGTTVAGGQYGYGDFFKLTSNNGSWTASVLHSFIGGSSDGAYAGQFDMSAAGAFFGTTFAGGPNNDGCAYELTQTGGTWTETILYCFRGSSDGSEPYGLRLDNTTGNLFGVTQFGGSSNDGTVFELSPSGNSWRETILHAFTGAPNDGAFPQAGPALNGKRGTLYGTTAEGGVDNGGTVFTVQP